MDRIWTRGSSSCPLKWRGPFNPDRANRAAELSPARQAQRLDLQHRLRVLLLPVEGSALSQRQAPHVGGDARELYPPAAGIPPHARGDGRLAGGRADPDEARILRARGRTGGKIPPARPDGSADLSDQRPAARRRLVRLLQETQLSRRPQRRRAARAARRLPARPKGQGTFDLVMRGWRFLQDSRRRVQYPLHGQRRQSRSMGEGSTASFATNSARNGCSSSRSSSGRRPRRSPSPTRAGATGPARESACSIRRPAISSPTARSGASNTAAFSSTFSRNGCGATWEKCSSSCST